MNNSTSKKPLAQLLQENQFIGWTCRLDYDQAVVLTSDDLKARAHGVPQHCLLLATALNPKMSDDTAADEIILLRVIGSAPLPLDDELLQRKAEFLKNRELKIASGDSPKSEFQFGGLRCRILGTFYLKDGKLHLSSDLENYANAVDFDVYRPSGPALETIVNYISAERTAIAELEAQRLGIKGNLPHFPIGTVRYSSTDRWQRSDGVEKAVFHLNAIDFLSRRTAIFGMTRTGKSNTIKQLVSVAVHAGVESRLKIGQIIYDLNGEYANANQQDKGSLAEVFPTETIRYRMIPTPGFEPILNNFYTQVAEGHQTLRGLIELNRVARSADTDAFLSMEFSEPRKEDFDSETAYHHQLVRYQRKVAAYHALLARAGFEPPPDFKITFEAGASVRTKVNPVVDPANGLTPVQACEWFQLARQIQDELITGDNQSWVEPDTNVLMNLLLQKNDHGAYIPGFRVLQPFKEYHAPNRTTDVCDEIYQHLLAGKIVILDLSVGNPEQRERLSKRIARHILSSSMSVFNSGQVPPNIVVYVEEAHNIIGRNESLNTVWPTMAKEGAKARLATVYATQEVSSIHPNILANTENIICAHLNNEDEIRELAKYYDFRDFAQSIIRAQDVGFVRVKTLSNPFVIPVQIDKFDPEREKQRARASR